MVGIARLAAESSLLEAKRQVEYLQIETRQFLGRSSNPHMLFVWTINPYRGCEFGCKYCYARYAHEFMELRDPLQFERKIFAKRFDAAAFRAELRKVKDSQPIWIGTATDPYQPAERRYGVTRQILETLAPYPGLNVGLTTKSHLVARDAALLTKVQVNMTVTTLDAKLARLLEPMAPRPDLRLAAVQSMAAAGVRVHVQSHPIMPLINDLEEDLDAICAAAKRAGAVSYSAAPLFLKPCAARVFMPFLERHRPHLVRRYRERYERNAYLQGAYPEMIRDRVRTIAKRHGMHHSQSEYPLPDWTQKAQLPLF